MSELIDQTEFIKNTIKYLHNLTTFCVHNNLPTLESVFTTKRIIVERRNSIFLPQSTSRISNKCQRCLLEFSDGPASHKITPRKKKYKFAKKVSKKLDKNSPLTEYQKKYQKRINNFNRNQLVTTCRFCKREHAIKMDIPKTQKITNIPVIPSKKKKNKKKDRFSGLNQEAVISLTPSSERNPDNSEMNKMEITNKRTKLKMSKANKKPIDTPTIIENPKEHEKIKKKKKKNLDKLSHLLSSVSKKTKKPSVSLKNFLQEL